MGSNVPAITEIGDGRLLMAAWIPIGGWGGPLVLRELVQFPDGRIGSKWMKEIMPKTGRAEILAPASVGPTTFPASGKSFMLTFNVQPVEVKKGRLGISLLPENGEHTGCELQIALHDQRAQFAPASLDHFAAGERSLREGGAPQQASN